MKFLCLKELAFALVQSCFRTFVYWPVRLQKVRLEENFKEVPCQALNSVVNGEEVDLFPILDVRAGMDAGMSKT